MGGDWFEELSKKFEYKHLLVIPLFTIPTLLFTKVTIIALLFIITLGISYIGQKTRIKKFGLELATFTTIMMGVSFGAVPGAITG